jgi:sodium/potassium-transporting ATPase subunit alpha
VPLLQSANMAFMGCNIVEGQGTGLVIATGAQNQLAKIASAVASVGTATTGLQKDINRFVLIIATIAGITTVVVVLEWAFYLRVQHTAFLSVSSMISDAIGVLVAFVPEGLPLALSMGLTLIARRLCLQHHVLAKQLSIIETMGSMSMLCSDKTGTLTQNKMTVRNVVAATGLLPVDAFTFSPTAGALVEAVLRGAVLCNQAKMTVAGGAAEQTAPTTATTSVKVGDVEAGIGVATHAADGTKTEAVGSNGIDKALLNYAYGRNAIDAVFATWRVQSLMTFNSTVKIAAVVASNYHLPQTERAGSGRGHGQGRCALVIVKGAPEHVLSRCTGYLDAHGAVQPMTDAFLQTVKDGIAAVSAEGQRVIGMAQRTLPSTEYPESYAFTSDPTPNYPLDGLTFVACVAVSDPPRDGVREAIATLRGAGIKVRRALLHDKRMEAALSFPMEALSRPMPRAMSSLPPSSTPCAACVHQYHRWRW